jgi:methylenetetrahydrofolate reductase (NADPH)
VSIRKRPGTVAICAAIMNRYDVDAVPHLICGGFTKDETENALIDLNFLGIKNVLALRGDNAIGERHFKPEVNGNTNALDLIHQIRNMNSGIYLDEELKNPNPTNFCIGAAAYPEKHIDAPNMEVDLNFLKRKVDAGASFLTTQMFFDNDKFFAFVENCRKFGINVPIIPGLKPITTKKQIYSLPKIFNIDIPNDLFQAVNDAKDNSDAEMVGIQWCVQQCKELIAQNVPVIHFYTMSRSHSTHEVAKQVF